MSQNSSEGRPDPIDVWQNVLARSELEEQFEHLRKTLKGLAEALASADVPRDDPSYLQGVVEDVHVKRAVDVIVGFARHPDIWAKVGSPDLFISFASQQKAEVGDWIKQLEKASYRCFFADESIEYSQDWAEEIWHAVRVCRCFLPIVTPDWIHSHWCAYELGAAFALNKAVVPIIVGDTAAPRPVCDCQGFKVAQASRLKDLVNTDSDQWHRILGELRRLCYRNVDPPGPHPR